MSFLQIKKLNQILQAQQRTEEEQSQLEQFILLMIPQFNKYQKKLLKMICENLYYQEVQQDSIITQEGQKANKFFVLLQGQLVQFRGSKKFLETPEEFKPLQQQIEEQLQQRQDFIKSIDQVMAICDHEFIKRQNYKYTTCTSTQCMIAYFNNENFKIQLQQIQEQENQQKYTIQFLRQISLFQSLDEKTVQSIYFNLDLKQYKTKEFVIKEQETYQSFFIVKSGLFQVFFQKQIYQNKEPIKLYETGQFFGHYEINEKIQKRKFSVICVQSGELYCMSQCLYKQKILHNESMAFKLRILPIFEAEIQDLLSKEKYIDVKALPKIRMYPALMMKKQTKSVTQRQNIAIQIPKLISGQRMSLNFY